MADQRIVPVCEIERAVGADLRVGRAEIRIGRIEQIVGHLGGFAVFVDTRFLAPRAFVARAIVTQREGGEAVHVAHTREDEEPLHIVRKYREQYE